MSSFVSLSLPKSTRERSGKLYDVVLCFAPMTYGRGCLDGIRVAPFLSSGTSKDAHPWTMLELALQVVYGSNNPEALRVSRHLPQSASIVTSTSIFRKLLKLAVAERESVMRHTFATNSEILSRWRYLSEGHFCNKNLSSLRSVCVP